MDLKRSTMHLMILKCVRIALTSMLSRDIRKIKEDLGVLNVAPSSYFLEVIFGSGILLSA